MKAKEGETVLPGRSGRLLLGPGPVRDCGTEAERRKGAVKGSVWGGGGPGRERDIGAEVRTASVSQQSQAELDRGGAAESGALTPRCHRLEALRRVQEALPPSEMASPSLLKAIGWKG